MREHRPPRVISLHKDGITLGDPSREGKRERERDLLSQKGKPREARLLEFTRFDACLRVSPGFRQRALEDISAWVGRVYPAQARSATVDWRRSGEFRWTIALDSHGPWRYSTFFGCLYRGLDEKDSERALRYPASRHMYRGQRARRILLRDSRRRKTVLPRHEDGKRERKTIAIYARM